MTTTLRDALAAARINRMKERAAKAWAKARPNPDCACLACQIKRAIGGGSVRFVDPTHGEPADAPPAPASHLN